MKNKKGSVTLIDKKSNRRKPYRVQIHVGYKDNGSPIRETIGYVKDKSEGNKMLNDYYNKRYDLKNMDISFNYLYNMWYEYKARTGITEKTAKKLHSRVKKYEKIKLLRFSEITRADLQKIIDDNSHLTTDYLRKVISIYKQMYVFAKANNIKLYADASALLIFPKEKKSTLHKVIPKDKIIELWNNRNDIIDIALCCIYTGVRPGELFVIEEVHDNYFITGSKTEAGMHRVIPLADDIKDTFHKVYNSGILNEISNEDTFYHRFKKVSLLSEYTPYDTRHTFATLMDELQVPNNIIKTIMGHSISDLTKDVYTHIEIERLIDAVNKISTIIKI